MSKMAAAPNRAVPNRQRTNIMKKGTQSIKRKPFVAPSHPPRFFLARGRSLHTAGRESVAVAVG